MTYNVPSSDLLNPSYLSPAIALWFCVSTDDDPHDGLFALLNAGTARELADHAERGFVRARAAGFPIDPEEFVDALAVAIASFQQSAGEGVRVGLTSSWYGYGMPALEITHKLAASLMVTKPSRELLEETPPPFPTFVIYVPNKLLTVNSSHGPADVRSVIVGHRTAAHTKPDARWCTCTLTDQPVTLWRVQKSFTDLVLENVDDAKSTSIFDYGLDEVDDRSQMLLHRLIGNLVLYVSDPSRMQPIGTGHGGGSLSSRKTAEPVKRVFRVTSDVRHDFRQVVKDYVSGTGQKLNMQLFVEGHFKLQVHGVGRTLRKRIHIEPYWRGPEDAPIALRKHHYE